MSGETITDTSTTGQVSGTPRGGVRQGDRSDAGVPKSGSAGTTPSASQLKNALKGEDYASQVQMLSPEPRLGPDKMRAGVDANGNRRIGREGALGLAGGNRDPEGAGVTGKVTQGDERQPETAPEVVGRRERVIHRAEGQEKREDAIDIAERFVGFDPRMLRAVGELIGVGAEVAEPPGPAFVEGL